MIIVKLMGGLGNQMFQYAAGKALSIEKNTSVQVDLNFLLDRTPRKNFTFRDFDLEDIFTLKVEKANQEDINIFTRKPSRLNSLVKKLLWKSDLPVYYYEPYFHFNEQFFELPSSTYLEGYFQSEKYFKSIASQLSKDFTFKTGIVPSSKAMERAIITSDSVCLNIRRTDFLTIQFHGVCGMEYYKSAMEIMKEQLSNPHFFVFTDDHQWTKDNFNLPYPITIIGPEHDGYKYGNKFQLMVLCKNFIIPNSSFAWWAAWLSTNPSKKVIAPINWFNDNSVNTQDLIPKNWIRIPN